MGIFDRLASLIKSNVNDLISSAENPEKMLNQIIVDMRDQLVKAKQQVAAAIADEKRLRDQFEAEYKQSQDWEQKAMLAIKEGRDDLAKQALVRQGEHYAHAQQLETTWQAHQLETEKLKNALRDLNDKIEEAKRKKNLLLARQRRGAGAEAHLGDDVRPVGEVGLRGVRADGREDRAERAHDQSLVRDRRGVLGRSPAARLQAPREVIDLDRCRRAAPRAQAEDGAPPVACAGGEAPARRRLGWGNVPAEETVHAEIEEADGKQNG